MKLETYPDREFMMMELADTLAGALNSALMTHERASFAVPGGTTPGPLFDTLAAVDLDWARVTVLLGDERWVPESSERSNARLVRERLLTDRAAEASFLGFWRDDATPETAAEAASAALRPHLPLSLLLLGMGDDMHTASLFPGASGLEKALASDAPPVLPTVGPSGEPRLSLTAPALGGAMATHILITGPAKRAALEQAAKMSDPSRAPISLVLSTATVHWAE